MHVISDLVHTCVWLWLTLCLCTEKTQPHMAAHAWALTLAPQMQIHTSIAGIKQREITGHLSEQIIQKTLKNK